MTQGFMKDKKFHPIKSYTKVRKSRDQKSKLQGIRLRREVKKLSDSDRKQLFGKLNSIGVSVSKSQRRIISNKLWQDNINRAKKRLKEKEKFFLTTNHLMETFAFGLDQKTGLVRTLGFIGHENKDNPEDVRRIPSQRLSPERKKRAEQEHEDFSARQLAELTTSLKKIIKDPDFMSSKSGVWGYTDKRIFLPTYGEGLRFGQTPEDRKNRVLHFSSASMAIGTDVSMDALVEAKDDGVDSNLLNRNSSVSDLLDVSVIQVSQDFSNQPIFLKLAKRSYLIGQTGLVKKK